SPPTPTRFPYTTLFRSEDEDAALSRVGAGAQVTTVPGEEEVDEVYRKAIEEKNQQAADLAQRIGGSALPTPIGMSKDSGLGSVRSEERRGGKEGSARGS